jgi:hypothetical protein
MNEEDPLPRPKCEREDAHPVVPAVLAGSMAVIVAVCLLCGFLIAGRTGNRASGLPGPEGIFQHGPQERTDIDRAWDTVNGSGGTVPDTYAWIDRQAGIVQIPIDRAIDLVCAEQKPEPASPKPRHFRDE